MVEACANCRFFRFVESFDPGVGACRRRPPVWTGPDDANDEGMFAFPRVTQATWCGEWEPIGEVAFTLTDAEREAVERACCSLGGVIDTSAECTQWDAEARETLLSLLERTK